MFGELTLILLVLSFYPHVYTRRCLCFPPPTVLQNDVPLREKSKMGGGDPQITMSHSTAELLRFPWPWVINRMEGTLPKAHTTDGTVRACAKNRLVHG